jgi:hypothetical protein
VEYLLHTETPDPDEYREVLETVLHAALQARTALYDVRRQVTEELGAVPVSR